LGAAIYAIAKDIWPIGIVFVVYKLFPYFPFILLISPEPGMTPQVLISVINANDQINWVKPADVGQT
jgi:hypothetical protein